MKNRESLSIGFIGGGNMARAIISGLVQQHPKESIYVSDLNQEKCHYFSKTFGIHSSTDYTTFIEQVDVIVLAIKPQGFPELIRTLKTHISAKQLVISIAAGVPINTIEKAFGVDKLAIIRAMPNTPATIGLGATALFPNPYVSNANHQIAQLIFTSCGEAVWLDNEEEISAVVAVSGSSPAYFFYMMEIMTQVGVELGLSADNSEKLTKQAMLGAARFSQLSDETLGQLKKNVMSPQGTTEQAIFSLERNHLDNVLKEAMEAAYQRDQSLSKEITQAVEKNI